jgi:hypothetical protein
LAARRVWVGWGVSEAMEAFVTSLAGGSVASSQPNEYNIGDDGGRREQESLHDLLRALEFKLHSGRFEAVVLEKLGVIPSNFRPRKGVPHH